MDILSVIFGLTLGMIIGDIVSDSRVHRANEQARKSRAEHLSGIEHEAYLRKENENLREANEYWKNVNARRHLQ